MAANHKKTSSGQSKSKKWVSRRDLIEWGVMGALIAILYATGWHTEVLGRLQQLVLWTGIMQPDTEMPVDDQQAVSRNMELVSLEGKPADLGDFDGKVIFINFWATWCPPCIAEMPNIQNLYEDYKNHDNVAFLMISADEDRSKARQFVERKEFTFPIYFEAGYRPPEFGSTLLPTTYVINKDGKIVLEKRGMAHYDSEQFRAFLDSLAAQ